MIKSKPFTLVLSKTRFIIVLTQCLLYLIVVGVKTGESRVGVPNYASKADGNRRQGTRCFTQVRALLMEVKPYVLLDLFLIIWVVQELIYHEIEEAKP